MRTRFLNQCMLTKGKCNGERPACKACRDRDLLCEYASEPGVTPVAALQRKYESLQAESSDEHNLLGLLHTSSEEEAIKALAYLRSSDDIQATLNQARNIPHVSSGLAALDIPPRRPAYQATSQSGLQATRASMDTPSVYPELNGSDGGIPWALPIEPYVCWCILLALSCKRAVILFTLCHALNTDIYCLQFSSRVRWGEYLVAQDNQEDSQRHRIRPEPQPSCDRHIKARHRKN